MFAPPDGESYRIRRGFRLWGVMIQDGERVTNRTLLNRAVALGIGGLWLSIAWRLVGHGAWFMPFFLLGSAAALTACAGEAAKVIPTRRLAAWLDRLTFGPGDFAEAMDRVARPR